MPFLMRGYFMIKFGRWKHFKGNTYEVIANGFDSEDGQPIVVYRDMDGERKVWTRKESEWQEIVTKDGASLHRFTYLEKEEEIKETIFQENNFRIEIIKSNGEVSEKDFWYDQKENEFVSLLSGSATIDFGDKLLELKPNDKVMIKKGQRHRIVKTSIDTIWLCLFFST